ncbi:MAG: hypothetical protein DRJ37_04780 [Thermoprotei archaeon]|nr:MAG: hypothetical protein DRJ37_04780 [Thermoprotei archaeon]
MSKYISSEVLDKCPTLKKWIKDHKGWPSDILSATIARPGCKFNYWGTSTKDWCSRDPFLVKVYGDIVYWPREKRERLFNKIVGLYCEKGESDEVNIEVNDLLADYPQDSRFPVVGLKVHHYLTWVLRQRLMGRDTNTLYIIRLTVPLLRIAHRLRSLREYQEKRKCTINGLWAMFKHYNPMRIGDELYIVLTGYENPDEILEELTRTRLDVDIEIYEYKIGRTPVQVYGRPYRIVEDYSLTSYSFGEAVEWGFSAGSAMWARHFEEPYVAWISIMPKNGLLDASKEFVEYAEGVLARMEREEVKPPIESEVPVSPDVLVAVIEGYGEFLSHIRAVLRANAIVCSFDRALFIRGIREPAYAVRLYANVDDVREKLHIGTILSIVVTEPKHPFWHVLTLITREDGVIFALGGKTVTLRGDDIKLLKQVTPTLRRVSRTAFYRIVRTSRKDDPEVLKFKIEGMAQDGKIDRRAADKLCWLIDELCRKYPDTVKDVIPQALRALVPFTRRERER